MANEATVIVGKLDDKALRDSIDSLVNTVREKTQKMANDFDASIKQMQTSLKNLGKSDINSTGTSDGGSSKRVKAQNAETQSVEATEKAYDKLLGTLQYTRREVSAISQKKFMSSEELDRYEQELKRIAELETKLNEVQGQLALARAKSWQTSPNMKEYTDGLVRTSDELKKLHDYYKNGESLFARQTAAAKEYTQEVINQANIIRETMKRQQSDTAFYGKYVIYDPSVQSQNLSIEEQIARAMKEEHEAAQKIVQTRKEEEGVIENIVVGEKKIEEAQQQRAAQNQKKTFNDYDNLRTAIASVLHIQEQDVILANESVASYNKLNATLKQLQEAYNKLNAEERNSDNGKVLAASISEVQRGLSKIQQQASRPTNLKAVLGLDERTLDEISYKMQQLARYRSGIDITDTQKASEIQQVNKAYYELQKKQQEILGQNKSMLESNNALSRSFNYMKNRLAFYFTVGASSQFVKQIYEIRGQYELLERSIGILIDNMQKGSQIFAELNSMAIKSPFTTMELGAAAKQLVAYDVAASDVVDTTKRLADMAAAVGIPIERLTYALGQIRSYEYLNARDARMFANAGIPLVRELADMYTKLEGRLVSTADVYDRIKKKAVSYNDVMKTVNKMTDEGGKFFNFQEKAADTMKVKLANLTLAYNNMLNEMGKNNQSMLTQPLIWLKSMFESWKKIEHAIYSVIIAYGLLKAAQTAYIAYSQKVGILTAAADVASKKLVSTLYSLRASMAALASNPMTWIGAAAAAVAYLAFEWWELKKANEEFSKSLKENTDENIEHINKFFKEYKKQLEDIKSANATDQQKMWEKISDEIKNSTKNADEYIDLLNKIPDLSERIRQAETILESSKSMQNIASQTKVDLGGGFADASLADNLVSYEKAMDSLIKKFGSLEKAEEHYKGRVWGGGDIKVKTRWGEYVTELKAVDVELNALSEKLGGLKVWGGTGEQQLAAIREYANTIRDAFLATEKGQKISVSGRAKLNSFFDEWITEQAKFNNAIDSERAIIEKNRTAWDDFFKYFSSEDQRRVDYMIRTNKTGSEEFKEIWDRAAGEMAKSSVASYNIIQQQIADLRNTPDIVLRVVYKQTSETLDDQQKEFEKDFLTPENAGVISMEKYFEEEDKLRRKYGRFQRKQDEDNVEWEKRLGEEYQDNVKTLESLNKQLSKGAELSTASRKQKEKERDALIETNKALDEVAKKQNFDFDQFKKGGKSSQKDVLGEALQKEVEIVTNMQKRFKEYRSEGVSAQDAITKATEEYGKTLKSTNDTLATFGVTGTKSGNQLAAMGLRDVRDYFKDLLADASRLGNAKGIEAIEKAIANLNVEINKVDYKKVAEGLNNELAKLKEEYELSVELAAEPEMGDMFLNLFDIDPDALPQTIDQYAERVLQRLNNYLKRENLELPSLNLTDDDLNAFRDKMYEGLLSEGAFNYIESQVKQLRDMRKEDAQDTMKEWQQLIEKYGDLQSKLIKIYKDGTQEQMSIVKKFGSDEQLKESLDIVKQINISQDPAEITRLQGELARVLKEVVKDNPIAKKTLTASLGSQESGLSKAYWEDFKESDLYTMTFEDMSRNSTRAIQLIIDKLEMLKDKVKEDPASMKALVKSLEDARKELEGRSSTVTIVDGLKEMREAAKEVDTTMRNLAEADAEVESAEEYLDFANRYEDTSLLAEATERLRVARERQAEAEKEAAKAENKYRSAQIKVKAGCEVLSNELQNLQGIFSTVADLFAEAGDEDTAEAINAISEGFSVMITVIMGVVAAMTLLETTQPYLLAIAAALSIIVGLVSFLSGRSDKKIVKQIEESERAVKRLELSYKALQNAIEDAYGTAKYSLQQMSILNKQMELEEIQRQIELEQRRTGKHRDEDKILELQGKELDLQNEISKATKEMTNDMLGISNVGSAAEQLVSSMIDAFKDGEDYMLKFSESFEDMIDNMVMKAIVSRVIGERLQSIFDMLEQRTQSRTEGISDMMEALSRERESIDKELAEKSKMLADFRNWGVTDSINAEISTLQRQRDDIEKQLLQQQELYEAAMRVTPNDVQEVRNMVDGFKGNVEEEFKMWMDLFGITFGQNNEGEKAGLSALQQGIQSVTETTANAIEGYMNSIWQQAYLRNELLTEIRNALVYVDSDMTMSVQAQMLLQLQQSYQVQMSIQATLEGWSNANGQAVRVELI